MVSDYETMNCLCDAYSDFFHPGSDLRSSASSVTRSITEQIFTLPLHWTKAIDFPETTTHAIDFGPGGANGVGPIVSRILSGRGVRVIVLGDKYKGDELYDSKTVKYEDWWSKKWAPRLIKTRSAFPLMRVEVRVLTSSL